MTADSGTSAYRGRLVVEVTAGTSSGAETGEEEVQPSSDRLSTGPRVWTAAVPLWKPLTILVVSRLASWVVLYVSEPISHAPSPFRVRGWDSGWYVRAAQHGWPHVVPKGQSTLAFFPSLPLLIRLTHAVLGFNWNTSGNLAMFATEIPMAVCVWLLARQLWDEPTADRATILLCFAPGAYVFSLIYTEPLFIAAAALCLYGLRRRQWLLAGAAASVAGATRVDGAVLILCCAWEAGWAIWQRRDWWSLSSVLLAPTGIAAWFSYVWATTGSATAWLSVERKGWGIRTSISAFGQIVHRVDLHGRSDLNGIVTIASTAVALGLLLLLAQSRAPAILLIFSVVVVGLPFFSTPEGIHPRYVMNAFPLLLVVAYRVKGELFGLVVGLSAMIMAALLVVTVSSLALVP